MSIDWSKTYKGALRGSRGKFGSYAEMLQHQQARREEIKKSQEAFKAIEPMLKEMLLDHMVNRKTIRVLAPIKYYTEKMNKSDTGASFSNDLDVIPAGTELVFQRLDKTMGQWIFKSTTSEKEYEIYDTPTVTLPGGPYGQYTVANPGFYGLLTATSIYQTVTEALKSNESEE